MFDGIGFPVTRVDWVMVWDAMAVTLFSFMPWDR